MNYEHGRPRKGPPDLFQIIGEDRPFARAAARLTGEVVNVGVRYIARLGGAPSLRLATARVRWVEALD